MTPDEVGRGLVEAVPGAAYAVAHGQVTVSVPAEHWHAAAAAARDRLDATFFDWLSAVDEPPDAIAVTCHLWSVAGRHGVLLQATLPRERPRLASVTDLFAGAAWHERETHEMFGVDFAGNPDLRPLLLPDGFAGHPLRKDFVLAARVAKPFPGAKEPGESGTPSRVRRRLLPPGVPAPGEWGPA